MSFVSYEFMAFVAVLAFVYYLVPRRAQWIVLLVGSAWFYYVCDAAQAIYIAAAIVITYVWSLLIYRMIENEEAHIASLGDDVSRKEKRQHRISFRKKRNCVLAVGIVLLLALLVGTKYLGFILGNIPIFGGTGDMFTDVAIPLGISFFTLQTIGYLVDISRGLISPERNILRLALFIAFFPQLVQGPISRFSELSETLGREHDFNAQNMVFAIERILWGFFKKLVIADRALIYVQEVVNDVPDYRGGMAFICIVIYTLQIYADFTGGIDITIGVAQCFGVKVMENFERPYFSTSLKEYWRRWHISMARWFREYLFYPLSICGWMKAVSGFMGKVFGAGASKKVPVYLSSFIVWFLTGLWHGASWNFVTWGIMNFLILMISEELEPLYARFHNCFAWSNTRGYHIFMIIRTLAMLGILKMFDCFTDLGQMVDMLLSVFEPAGWHEAVSGGLLGFGLAAWDYIILIIGTIIMWAVSMRQEYHGSVRAQIKALPGFVRCIIWCGLFFAVVTLGEYGVGYEAANFIYNQF